MNFHKILNYTRFAWHIICNKIGGISPFSISLDITDECNSKCTICGIWQKSPKYDLDLQIFEQQMKSSKYLKQIILFNIGGGEPFTRLEILKRIIEIICRYAHPLQIRIVTNGLLTEIITEFFKSNKFIKDIPIGLKISLDGFGDVYEKIRGVPNGDKKVMETINSIQLLQKSNPRLEKLIDIEIGFTLLKDNLHQLDQVFQFAADNNIGFFYKPVLKGGRFYNENQLPMDISISDPQEIQRLLHFNQKLLNYIKHNRKWTEKLSFKLFYRYYNKILSNQNYYISCQALKNSFYLAPNGDIFSCLLSPTPIDNINKTPFDVIWKNIKAKEFRLKNKTKPCWCLTPCDSIPSLITGHILWSLF